MTVAALSDRQLWVDSCRSRRTRALVTSEANGWSSQMQLPRKRLGTPATRSTDNRPFLLVADQPLAVGHE